MSPLALEPEFSQFGSEQLRLRLLEWQAEQDHHKRSNTKDRLHQKNIQLKEQLDIVYEEEQKYERHHLQEMEQLKGGCSPHSFASPPPMSPVPQVVSNNIAAVSKPIAPGCLQATSEVPMFVLPLLPHPEQFQFYNQYLMAYSSWVNWHKFTSPTSLETYIMCQVIN